MPNYILLLHHEERARPEMSPDEIQAMIQKYVAWRNKVGNGRAVSGHKLRNSEGRVMRGSGGGVAVKDGPYAEAREVIGGLFIVEAGTYEEAVELSRDCPHLEYGGAIEIREIQPT
ncbi:MAG: YciI family protein [Vicinamibacterales bacterium]